jgi:hypothetical protein
MQLGCLRAVLREALLTRKSEEDFVRKFIIFYRLQVVVRLNK